ncbi:hypothetical protein [Abyssisolibacter fermentans]|uniref:hypothetical protein n=1 Tax=Abyssisolibacter fermentans TaxID=1766203 RepID=UPI00082CDFCB|nr:hypothetical protein [Abyssisolibacter fermentans]
MVTLTLILLTSCTLNKDKTTVNEIEYLKQKSISVSLATYTGTKNILVNNSTEKSRDYLLDTMFRNTNKEVLIEKIDLNSFEKKDKRIIITISIQEKPFKSILFHQFIYEFINDKWVIVDFALDA